MYSVSWVTDDRGRNLGAGFHGCHVEDDHAVENEGDSTLVFEPHQVLHARTAQQVREHCGADVHYYCKYQQQILVISESKSIEIEQDRMIKLKI